MSAWQWQQAVLFQLVWFLAILGGNDVLGVLLLLFLWHVWRSPTRATDWLVLPLGLLGFGQDLMLMAFGVFEFVSFPYWLGCLWVMFVLTLGHSLIYLQQLSWPWLSVIGFVTGSYIYGLSSTLGAVFLPFGFVMTGLLVGVLWAALLPTLVYCDRRIRLR